MKSFAREEAAAFLAACWCWPEIRGQRVAHERQGLRRQGVRLWYLSMERKSSQPTSQLEGKKTSLCNIASYKYDTYLMEQKYIPKHSMCFKKKKKSWQVAYIV